MPGSAAGTACRAIDVRARESRSCERWAAGSQMQAPMSGVSDQGAICVAKGPQGLRKGRNHQDDGRGEEIIKPRALAVCARSGRSALEMSMERWLHRGPVAGATCAATPGSGFFQKHRLEHEAALLGLAVDVMVAVAMDQANALDLRALLDHGR